MAAHHRKLLRILPVLLPALAILVIVSLIWQILGGPLRVDRNARLAHQLVESLENRFPGAEFGGAASYDGEVIYLTVINRLDAPERVEVETWLRNQKIEQKIAPRISLRFLVDKEENDIIID